MSNSKAVALINGKGPSSRKKLQVPIQKGFHFTLKSNPEASFQCGDILNIIHYQDFYKQDLQQSYRRKFKFPRYPTVDLSFYEVQL